MEGRHTIDRGEHHGTAVVHIDDSCCAGISAEEMARRLAEVDRVIWQINREHAAAEAAKGARQP